MSRYGAFTYVVDATFTSEDQPYRVTAYGSVDKNASRVVTSNSHGSHEELVRNGFDGSHWAFYVLNRGHAGELCWARASVRPLPLQQFTYDFPPGQAPTFLGQEKFGDATVNHFEYDSPRLNSASGWYFRSLRQSLYSEVGGDRRLLKTAKHSGGGVAYEASLVSLAREEPSAAITFDVPSSCGRAMEQVLVGGAASAPVHRTFSPSGRASDFWRKQMLMRTELLFAVDGNTTAITTATAVGSGGHDGEARSIAGCWPSACLVR